MDLDALANTLNRLWVVRAGPRPSKDANRASHDTLRIMWRYGPNAPKWPQHTGPLYRRDSGDPPPALWTAAAITEAETAYRAADVTTRGLPDLLSLARNPAQMELRSALVLPRPRPDVVASRTGLGSPETASRAATFALTCQHVGLALEDRAEILGDEAPARQLWDEAEAYLDAYVAVQPLVEQLTQPWWEKALTEIQQADWRSLNPPPASKVWNPPKPQRIPVRLR